MIDAIDLSLITNGLAALNRIPATATQWQRTALDDAAKRWLNAGFSPLAARVWIEAGVEKPDLAVTFEQARLTPNLVKAALGTANKWENQPIKTNALDEEKTIAAEMAARLDLTAPFRVVSMTPGLRRDQYGLGSSMWHVIDARGAIAHASPSNTATKNIADEANSLRGVNLTQKDIEDIRNIAHRMEPDLQTTQRDFADFLSDHIEWADEIAHAPGDDENPTGYIFCEKTIYQLANCAREEGNVELSDLHAHRTYGFIVLDQNESWIREMDFAERVKFDPDTHQIIVDPNGPADERTFVGRISDVRYTDRSDSFVIDSPEGKLRIGYDQRDVVGFEDVVEDGAQLAVTYGRNGKVVVEWARTAACNLLNGLKQEIPGFEIVRRDLEANRRYSGRIYGITADEVFQEVGRGKIRAHDRSTIEGYIGVSGDLVRIEYDNKMIGHVEPLDSERFRQPSKDTTEVDR